MANDCADGVYNIEYTDNTLNPIVVNKQTLIQDVLDITLLGQGRKEYGEVFNEDILHLLENFSAPEDPNNPGNPNTNLTSSNILEHPTKGQLWYNSTQLRMYVYTGTVWFALSVASDIAGNSGIIADGLPLPRPISSTTGYQFQYSECSWVVSPFSFPAEVDYSLCYTDTSANVTAQYRLSSEGFILSGYAFYSIIGIKNNDSIGTDVPVTPPPPSPTPYLSPSVTPNHPPVTLSPSPTPMPTSTVVVSASPLKATLYVSPSEGYPNGTNTSLVSPCFTNAAGDSNCFNTLAVVVQGLSGGQPPYTVNLSNVRFSSTITNTTTSITIPSSITYAYTGASGVAGQPVRTGVTATSTVKASGTIEETGNAQQIGCNNGSWSISINAGSYVTITDSVGRSLVLYTPAGSNGNVFGTSYTIPQGTYTDAYLSQSNCGTGGTGGIANSGGTSGPGGKGVIAQLDEPSSKCVDINSILPDGNIAGKVLMNQELLTCDPYDFFNCANSRVTHSETITRECVRIITESGASLVCSLNAPIPTLENGYMLANALNNQNIAVLRHNITKWEKVVSVEPVGEREVRHIAAGDRCFWAGETCDAFILHHNTK